MADGLMLPIVLISMYALLWRIPTQRWYDSYTRIIMAGLTSYALAKFVSAVWQPQAERPFEQLGIDAGAAYLNNPGFPSDHMLFATFLVLAVWYATRSRLLTGILAVLTLLVAIGRVLALVHTPIDVVGGVLFALIGVVWYNPYGKKRYQLKIAKKANK